MKGKGDAEILEYLEQGLAYVRECYGSVVWVTLLNQYVTIEAKETGDDQSRYHVAGAPHSGLCAFQELWLGGTVAFLPYLMPSIAVGVAFFILFSTEKLNLFNTYTLLIIVGTVKYIPFASRSSLNSMLQLSGEIEEAAIIQDIPWIKRMTRIIIPIQKSSIISGFLLPFMTCLRELSLFMLLCVQGFILSTTLDYFDEMGLYAFSSGINLILIVTILVCNTLVNKITGASLDKGIGG